MSNLDASVLQLTGLLPSVFQSHPLIECPSIIHNCQEEKCYVAKLPKKEEELNAHHTEAYHLPDGVTLHVRCAVCWLPFLFAHTRV